MPPLDRIRACDCIRPGCLVAQVACIVGEYWQEGKGSPDSGKQSMGGSEEVAEVLRGRGEVVRPSNRYASLSLDYFWKCLYGALLFRRGGREGFPGRQKCMSGDIA